MAESHHDRTEQPTQRRRQRARERGQVVHSRELQTALVLLVGVLGLKSIGPWMTAEILTRWRVSLAALDHQPLTAADVPGLAAAWWTWSLKLLLPLFALVSVAAVGGASLVQGGVVFSMQGLAPNLGRLNPVAGAQRLFSARTGFGLLRDLVKVALVGWVCAAGMRTAILELAAASDAGLADQMLRVGNLTLSLGLRAALVLLVVGLADYAYQRRQFFQDLKMTKQEVREELKETEGDPLVKGRIRSRQRELARRRMMEAVPTADVILTNPTSIAVALQYDPAKMQAPRVVAKGQRLIAERIKEIGRKFDIPIVEDKPLARALFRLAPIGGEIPTELYRAVAEILGYVYRVKGRLAPAGTRPERGGTP